uniref:Cirhin n=2 Tax=Anthurium amnicola TaxID=1678845 RepID=A0A1D1Z8K6_9ARAE
MEKLRVYRNDSLEWKPSAVLALATSADGSQVAAAREDGSMEIWLVSPGSVGWHCQLTIQGDPSSRVSSLAWLRSSSRSEGPGRLLSSSLDGSLSEWDLFSLRREVIVDSVGVAIWQMAVKPSCDTPHSSKTDSQLRINGSANVFSESSSESNQSDDEDDTGEIDSESNGWENQQLAIACDDGCVRLYASSDSDRLTYKRTFPKVNGRMLSVAWSLDVKLIFSGSSDGLVRCWDAIYAHEVYRITVGLGGLGSRLELCVWSLIFLRCGTLVSGDSTGSVQFWDSRHGTLLQAHSHHKGDVNALAASPSHDRVFSAGSDGQVILYKLFTEASAASKDDLSVEMISKWVYVRNVRAHTHDVRALTVAMPICAEDTLPAEKKNKIRGRKKPMEFSYRKWAHFGVPMLISAGDDTKLFAYSVREFTKFSPHDICPAPQRLPVKLALNTLADEIPLVLVQYPSWLDISTIQMQSGVTSGKQHGKNAATPLVARIKSKGSQQIICSALSNSGTFFAYSDHVKPCLFELRRNKARTCGWTVSKRKLPRGLPFAHTIVFSADSSRMMLSGHDRKIYMLDMEKLELITIFVPRRKDVSATVTPSEPPITRMFTSSDGQWLAAVNCFGDIYVFNLEINRQHWFIARLNGASVTAGGFPPGNSNILVITTSSNHVFVFDVEAKQLGEWSRRYSYVLPRRFQDFPGEIIGLSFPPSLCSTSVIVYSSRAMCLIDFVMPVGFDAVDLPNGSNLLSDNFQYPFMNVKAKRKRRDANHETKQSKINNFDFFEFRNPVLFVGHMLEHSLLVLEKPWMKVIQTFGAPVHRHIFGT